MFTEILFIVFMLVLGGLFPTKHDTSATTGNALVKFTAFLDKVSGKIAGTVFASNKGGNYVRSKGIPTNPQTSAQQAQRAIFGALAQSWRALGAVNRFTWNAIVDDFPYQNRLGETKTYSGATLYQKFNLNLSSVGVAPLAFPIAPQAVIGLRTLSVDVTVGATTLIVSAILTGAGTATDKFAIFATASASPGAKSLSNKLRQIGVSDADTIAGEDFWTRYTAVFGAPLLGSNIGFEVRPVNATSGQAGVPNYTVALVE